MKRGLPGLVAGAAALLVLGACSDDDDNNIDLDDVTVPDEITVPDISINVTTPDISLPDLTVPDITLPDISIPDGSVPEAAEDAIRGAFPDLEDAQVDCVVNAVEGGTELNDLTSLLDQCDIELQDLVPGG